MSEVRSFSNKAFSGLLLCTLGTSTVQIRQDWQITHPHLNITLRKLQMISFNQNHPSTFSVKYLHSALSIGLWLLWCYHSHDLLNPPLTLLRHQTPSQPPCSTNAGYWPDGIQNNMYRTRKPADSPFPSSH